MKYNKRQLIIKAISACVSIGMLILSWIYLFGMPRYVLLGAIIVFASLGVLIVSIDPSRRESFFKFTLVALAFFSFILIIFVILDSSGVLEKIQDAETLIEMIRATRHWGVIVFVIFVIFEVVFLPVPAALTAFIGTALFGPAFAFVLITIGTITGSVICFSLGKVFGKRLVTWMIGEQKTKEYAELLHERGRLVFIVMMIFPFFPDDILCLAAGITTMTYKYFILIIMITRPLMIAFICFFIEGSIIPFSGWGVPVWIAIIAVALVLFMLMGRLKNKIMNKKSDEDTENSSTK